MSDDARRSSDTERVEFTCQDCGLDVSRDPGMMDVDGLEPARCVSCTLEAMKR